MPISNKIGGNPKSQNTLVWALWYFCFDERTDLLHAIELPLQGKVHPDHLTMLILSVMDHRFLIAVICYITVLFSFFFFGKVENIFPKYNRDNVQK